MWSTWSCVVYERCSINRTALPCLELKIEEKCIRTRIILLDLHHQNPSMSSRCWQSGHQQLRLQPVWVHAATNGATTGPGRERGVLWQRRLSGGGFGGRGGDEAPGPPGRPAEDEWLADLQGAGWDAEPGVHHRLLPALGHHAAARHRHGQVWAAQAASAGQVRPLNTLCLGVLIHLYPVLRPTDYCLKSNLISF